MSGVRAPAEGVYGELERRFTQLSGLDGALAVLTWDQATLMPTGGGAARAEQLATLETLRHEILTDPAFVGLIGEAEADTGRLDEWQAANLARMAHSARRAAALPGDLVAALSRARSACELRWREARVADDYAAFAELFEPLLGLVRESAAAWGQTLGLDPYDALIDAYEPGMGAEQIDPLFDDLAGFLPEFLGQALEHQAAKPSRLRFEGHFPVALQEAVSRKLMACLGFDFERGRLDVSHHPFCGGVPDDVRITTRYDEADFTSALMGVLHETGHALFERGLPAAWRDQPVGEAPGMAAHESQSLLVEMQVCRGRAFLEFAAPLIAEAFASCADTTGPAWTVDNLERHALWVEPSRIRVDADEVTYPAHILLRTRLEKAMIAGELGVADLPGAFDDGLKALLGVSPERARNGCLQDVHWPEGLFGYFPCYTLGALAAAQIYAAACAAVPGISEAITRGDFTPLMGWLGEQIHGQGSRVATPELIARATGAPLGTAAFKTHLTQRYLGG